MSASARKVRCEASRCCSRHLITSQTQEGVKFGRCEYRLRRVESVRVAAENQETSEAVQRCKLVDETAGVVENLSLIARPVDWIRVLRKANHVKGPVRHFPGASTRCRSCNQLCNQLSELCFCAAASGRISRFQGEEAGGVA